jgi:hypothetical protein
MLIQCLVVGGIVSWSRHRREIRKQGLGAIEKQHQAIGIVPYMLRGGLIFGGLLCLLLIVIDITLPARGTFLEAESPGRAHLWHEMGLPPRDDAWFVLPFLLLRGRFPGASPQAFP